MAALTLSSIRPGILVLGVALTMASPALAADVSVRLDTGSGFAIKNNAGTLERLRVDETTGNLSRNGALFVHTTGTSNLFVGAGAGNPATTGAGGNTAVGYHALYSNTTGFSNSAFGESALLSNTTGLWNSAFGRGSLITNTTGSYNSAVGYRSLRDNVSGSANSAFGFHALAYNFSGSNNSALGGSALHANTTGFDNSAFGHAALRDNSTGFSNSAFGSGALRHNTATGNSALGHFALNNNTIGFENSGFGGRALASNTTGDRNSAFGYFALVSSTTGDRNSAFGYFGLGTNTAGDRNSAVGFFALGSNTTGTQNVAFGYRAGINQTTGSDNIYLSNLGVAAEGNTIRIGTPGAPPGTQTRAFIAGIRGVTTVNADAIPVLIDSAGQFGTVSSSRDVKKEIRDMGDATDHLLELRPVMFRYKEEQTLPSGGEVPPEYGLIAEEVAEVFPDLVVYDERGLPYTVKYHEMAPMLLNEMKKQQHTIQAQRQEMQTQQQEIAALTVRLARIETRAIGAPGEAQR